MSGPRALNIYYESITVVAYYRDMQTKGDQANHYAG